MNKYVSKALVLVATALFASGAFAQKSGSQSAPGPWYIGVGIGESDASIPTRTIDVANAQLSTAIGATSTIVNKDNRSTDTKIFVGYTVNRHFAAELGYAYLGQTQFTSDFRAGAPITTSLGTFNMKYKMSAFYLDAVGTLPLGETWSLLGRVGIAYSQARAVFEGQNVTLFASTDDTKESKIYAKFGAGVNYNINAAFLARAEWERYKLPDPLSDEKFNVDAVTLSILYRF